MNKKDVYRLAVKMAQVTLRDYFDAPNSFTDAYFMKNGKCKNAVKAIFDSLAPLLLIEIAKKVFYSCGHERLPGFPDHCLEQIEWIDNKTTKQCMGSAIK